MSDVVKLYNPANSAALSEKDIAGLQKLTDDELKQLAKAYPNSAMQRAYLLIIDSKKPAVKQLPTLSSFENLYNLRTKNSMKSYVALNFRGVKTKKTIIQKSKRTEILDLSDHELLSLPGFKTANLEIPAQEVAVGKTPKVKKQK